MIHRGVKTCSGSWDVFSAFLRCVPLLQPFPESENTPESDSKPNTQAVSNPWQRIKRTYLPLSAWHSKLPPPPPPTFPTGTSLALKVSGVTGVPPGGSAALRSSMISCRIKSKAWIPERRWINVHGGTPTKHFWCPGCWAVSLSFLKKAKNKGQYLDFRSSQRISSPVLQWPLVWRHLCLNILPIVSLMPKPQQKQQPPNIV